MEHVVSRNGRACLEPVASRRGRCWIDEQIDMKIGLRIGRVFGQIVQSFRPKDVVIKIKLTLHYRAGRLNIA